MGLSRRNALIGLGGLTAGGGALVGTGAFTTVQAERTVSVETAGDQGAFLALVPTSDPNGQDYAEINDDDLLEVTIPDVNLDAVTHIDNVFQVTNNGSQPVVVYFEELPGTDNPDGNAIDAGVKTDQIDADSVGPGQPTSNGIYDEDVADVSAPNSPDSSPTYNDIGVRLAVGETLKVGFYIDTSDEDLNDGLDSDDDESSSVGADEALMENLVIYASAEAAQNDDYQFVESNSSP